MNRRMFPAAPTSTRPATSAHTPTHTPAQLELEDTMTDTTTITELDDLTPQTCERGVHPDFAIDSEHAHTCPWCEIDRLREDNERVRQSRENAAEIITSRDTELAKLRTRVAELEKAAVDGRAALADLVEDHDDPGSNAYGALWLLRQATLTVEAQPDQAAEVLARRDAEVLDRAADELEAHCPEHGGRDTCFVECQCTAVDDLRQQAEKLRATA